MGRSPLISVCMITYGHEAYIKQAIEGVLMQECSYQIELIVADDCSPDHTQQIVQSIIQEHVNGSWIRYTRHIENKGMMPNFIWALQECHGTYVALCDGDDFWTDSFKLQKQVDFLENNPNYVMSFHPCEFLNPLQAFVKQPLEAVSYKYTVKNLLVKWGIPTAAIVFKNEAIKDGFPSWIYEMASGDIVLVLMLLEKGEFKLLSDYMCVYRQQNQGVSKEHFNTRMVHYRAVLYSHLNEFFNYKYEAAIYEALHEITLKHMPHLKPQKNEATFSQLLDEISKKLKKRLGLWRD